MLITSQNYVDQMSLFSVLSFLALHTNMDDNIRLWCFDRFKGGQNAFLCNKSLNPFHADGFSHIIDIINMDWSILYF